MNEITEFFGLCCRDVTLDFGKVNNTQVCPFTQRVCTKMRKSSPEIKIGTCSVKYREQDIIICPHRLLQRNQIFVDCLHLLNHEPGDELYLIPEVGIPGGKVDYFLVSARDGHIKDFVGIELQTLDTTGTVWPTRQRFLNERGIEVNIEDLHDRSSFAMNWKMTLKTILVQIHHKCKTFEYLHKHLVLIVQDPLYARMRETFNFTGITEVRDNDTVHIHSYNFIYDEENKVFNLSLDTRVSANSIDIANCLGLNVEGRVELETLVRALEPKLIDENRLRLF